MFRYVSRFSRAHRPVRTHSLIHWLALSMMGVACAGDGVGPTDTNGSISLSLASGVLTIVQGSSGSVTVTIQRSVGFDGSVTITVDGLPEGVTAGPLTFGPGAGTSAGQLSFAAAPDAIAGNEVVTIRASAAAVAQQTAELLLTVNAATGPGFSISVAPAQHTVEAGSSVQSTVTITRTGGFTGAVTMSSLNLPAGVSGTFVPEAPSGNISTLTLTAAPAAAASGPTPVTVRGMATGLPDQTAQVVLTVTEPAQSDEVTVDFCGASGIPLWVAIQDGAGPWMRVTGSGASYTFPILSNAGGVAWVIEDGMGGFRLFAFFGTRAELHTFGLDRCHGTPGAGKTVTGIVSGLPASDLGPIRLALGRTAPSPAPPIGLPGVTFSGVPNGSVDLIGGVATEDPINLLVTPSRMLIRRGLNPDPGSSIGEIDFEGQHSFAPAARSLTVVGHTGGETVRQRTRLLTANGAGLLATVDLQQNAWYGAPAAQLDAGDLQLLTIHVTEIAPPFPSRSVTRVIREPENLTVVLGPPLSTPTAEGIPAPGHARARAVLETQSEYNRFWFASFRQTEPGSTREVQVQMTPGYRGSGIGTVTLEIPDFTPVGGWDASWGLRTGVDVSWTVTAVGWTTPGGVIEPVLADGVTFREALRGGQLTP